MPLQILSKIFSLFFITVPAVLIFYFIFFIGERYVWPIPAYSAFILGSNKIETNCNRFEKGVLEEASSPKESSNKCWWLDSGGIFKVDGGIGKTVEKELPFNSPWQIEYGKNNPVDTDEGLHPQNLFRLVNTKKWENVSQRLIFKIKNYNVSSSPNRNGSNGVLLMSRYLDGDNLYYAGVRVDGTAVIKKKIKGTYVTLASTPYGTNTKYNAKTNPILLPIDRWIAIKFITSNITDKKVDLKLFIDFTGSGVWQPILEVEDNIKLSGYPPLSNPGMVGIRSDFMDVEFNNFNIESV